MQLEAVVFASAARSDIYDNMLNLSEDIQALLLARQQQSAPSDQSIASVDCKMELDSEEPTARGPDAQPLEALEPIERHSARAQDVMQSVMTKEQTLQAIDGFVARQRKEIDSNNQDEFLVPAGGRDATCARIDAKGTNCGVQIQLNVAFNDSGALERSTAAKPDTAGHSGGAHSLPLDGLAERVGNLSEHLSVRFTPASASIYNRVAALEDRLMMLEREFPPWSAEHFNQPDRKYTQPPPATVYRILPASVTAAAPEATADVSAIAPAHLDVPAPTPVSMSVQSRGGKRGRPRLSGSLVSKPQPTPRRKKHVDMNGSPLDPTGKPLFHICGRGVNSSLTRTILAQLQSKQAPAKPKSESGD
ncbi:hypothetical protein GGH95_000131 [Coemansia sp. RSA 1836]|nr:hypothetical protein GGH95_000131 [Coemansia sp. RSA 1836]